MGKVLVNRSYRGQRLTGQQRYAEEIGQRLSPGSSFHDARPWPALQRSKALVWAWVQAILPLRAGSRAVLSMTSRAPVWSRRHVVVVHDLFVIEHPEWFSRAYYWTHAPLLKAQIRAATALVAVSQPVADQLSAMGRRDVVVAPNAPSELFRQSDSTDSRVLTTHGIEPGSFFLAVGSRDPRKNLIGLAEAYSMLDEGVRKQHPLILVGGDASIYRQQQITWPEGTVDAGYVADDELRRLYRDAGTVVFASLAEGFGLPLVEAAASGASSLLISDIDVFRWICGDGARYVDPTSPAAIAEGMMAEIVEPTAMTMDLSRFTWEASAERISAVCLRDGRGARR